MARFKPHFCFTFEQGFSFVPAADFDGFRTFSSSITTTWIASSTTLREIRKELLGRTYIIRIRIMPHR